MKQLIIVTSILVLTGCSTIKEYWPRPHDSALFNNLVAVDIAVEQVNCEQPNWAPAKASAEQLARYAEWRGDPQRENLKGLLAHTERMSKGGSKMFCELGKKTAKQRIEAARSAWEGR
jgi:hypothetical protein